MANTNYRRARSFEYRVRDKLTAAGWVVMRGAGSKGDHKADLIAFRDDGAVAFVQCKTGSGFLTEPEWNRLVELAGWSPSWSAVVAARPPESTRLVWTELLGVKVRYARSQHVRPWDPARRGGIQWVESSLSL